MRSIEPWENFQVARYLEYHYPGLIIWFRAIPLNYQKSFLKECRANLLHASRKLFKLECKFSLFYPSKYVPLRKINFAPEEWLKQITASINALNFARSNLEWLYLYLLWIHKVTQGITQCYSLYCSEISGLTMQREIIMNSTSNLIARKWAYSSVQYCDRTGTKVMKSNHFLIEEFVPPNLACYVEKQ